MRGVLYVLPNTIANQANHTLSKQAIDVIANLNCFAVETLKTARRSIRSMGINTDFDSCKFFVIHHKTDELALVATLNSVLNVLQNGENVGILSDAGMAGIADPGSRLIALAHEHGIQVKPLVGPSSIFLALSASGFNGQKFTFHGYLPIEKRHRRADLKAMEAEVERSKETQIFMETPYRNQQLLTTITDTLKDETMLSICANATAVEEFIRTKPIRMWKRNRTDINKLPAIFLIGSVD